MKIDGSAKRAKMDEYFTRLREEDAKYRRFDELDMEYAQVGKQFSFNPFPVDSTFDPSSISLRDWLAYGLLLSEHITLAISPGGVGKSTLAMLIAVAVALGRSDMIPGRTVDTPDNVLIINSEDDLGEMQRRLAGILQQYEIDPAKLTGKFFVDSRYGRNGRLANHHEYGEVSDGPLVEEVIKFCREKNIRLIVFDPLVGFHDVPENDNGAMERVASVLRAIARRTGAAVLVAHHTRKAQASEDHAGDMDSGRGASALAAAARIAITVARMNKQTAEKLNIDWSIARHLRRIDDAKMNYAPAAEETTWFEMRDTRIANGEHVGVPVVFDMTGIAERAAEEKERESKAAKSLQRIKTARTIVGDEPSGTITQPLAIEQYQQVMALGRSAAQDHVRRLPIGKDTALIFRTEGGQELMIWRNSVGSDRQRRYEIEWAEVEVSEALNELAVPEFQGDRT
jgi:hypothetical protein